jgi:hypothetical protein
MPSRSSLLAKSQRHSNLSEGESRPGNGRELPAVRNDPGRNSAHPPAAVSSPGSPLIPASLRHYMIRDAAYFRAQARGLVPGNDWTGTDT